MILALSSFSTARGFVYKADTKHERSVLIGLTVVVAIIVLLMVGVVPFVLDYFGGPSGAGRLVLLGAVIASLLGLYGLALFAYYLPVIRSGKGWEYRVEDDTLTVRTPHRVTGEDLFIPLEDVAAILQERKFRSADDGEGRYGPREVLDIPRARKAAKAA